MELHQLRYVIRVAEESNFTRAAERLGVAQPSLSQQIRKLERELGFAVFERGPSGARVTRDGELFLPWVKTILDRVDEADLAAEEIRGMRRGRVTIGASPIAGMRLLPVLLRAIRSRWPGLTIQTREGGLSQILALLEIGEVDLAMVLLPIPETGLTCVPLFTEHLVVVLPPDSRHRVKDTVSLEEIRDEAFVLLSPQYGLRHLVLEECHKAGFIPRIAFESGDVGIVQGLVEAGIGLTVLPISAVRQDLNTVVKPVSARGERPQRRIGLAIRTDRYVPIAARQVFDLAAGLDYRRGTN